MEHSYINMCFTINLSCIQKHKRKRKNTSAANFSALHLINDPQGKTCKQFRIKIVQPCRVSFSWPKLKTHFHNFNICWRNVEKKMLKLKLMLVNCLLDNFNTQPTFARKSLQKNRKKYPGTRVYSIIVKMKELCHRNYDVFGSKLH